METEIKTPVQIIQELIAIHTTRIESADKLQDKEAANSLRPALTAAREQSELFIKELMSELSNFGDGVLPGIDRENEYELAWKDVSGRIDTISSGEVQEFFRSSEGILKNTYQHILEDGTTLPGSIQELVSKQQKELHVA